MDSRFRGNDGPLKKGGGVEGKLYFQSAEHLQKVFPQFGCLSQGKREKRLFLTHLTKKEYILFLFIIDGIILFVCMYDFPVCYDSFVGKIVMLIGVINLTCQNLI